MSQEKSNNVRVKLGIEKARELFAGASRETEGDVFKHSAYQSTLQIHGSPNFLWYQ
jgi:hypothetical protein